MISLSIFDSNGNSIEVKSNRNDPLMIFIPHDQLAPRPAMSLQNVTQMENLTLFNYHFVSLVSQENQSIASTRRRFVFFLFIEKKFVDFQILSR